MEIVFIEMCSNNIHSEINGIMHLCYNNFIQFKGIKNVAVFESTKHIKNHFIVGKDKNIMAEFSFMLSVLFIIFLLFVCFVVREMGEKQ